MLNCLMTNSSFLPGRFTRITEFSEGLEGLGLGLGGGGGGSLGLGGAGCGLFWNRKPGLGKGGRGGGGGLRDNGGPGGGGGTKGLNTEGLWAEDDKLCLGGRGTTGLLVFRESKSTGIRSPSLASSLDSRIGNSEEEGSSLGNLGKFTGTGGRLGLGRSCLLVVGGGRGGGKVGLLGLPLGLRRIPFGGVGVWTGFGGGAEKKSSPSSTSMVFSCFPKKSVKLKLGLFGGGGG